MCFVHNLVLFKWIIVCYYINRIKTYQKSRKFTTCESGQRICVILIYESCQKHQNGEKKVLQLQFVQSRPISSEMICFSYSWIFSSRKKNPNVDPRKRKQFMSVNWLWEENGNVYIFNQLGSFNSISHNISAHSSTKFNWTLKECFVAEKTFASLFSQNFSSLSPQIL